MTAAPSSPLKPPVPFLDRPEFQEPRVPGWSAPAQVTGPTERFIFDQPPMADQTFFMRAPGPGLPRSLEQIETESLELADQFRWPAPFVLEFRSLGPEGQRRAIGELMLAPSGPEEPIGEFYKRTFPRSAVEFLEQVPFVHLGAEARESRNTQRALRRLEAGVDDTVDRLRIFAFVEDQKRKGTSATEIAKIVGISMQFATELLMTEGLYAIPAGATKTLLRGALGKLAERSLARGLTRAAAFTVGGTVQANLNPRAVLAMEQMAMPELGIDELGQLTASFQEHDDAFEVVFGGLLDNWIQIVSERTGGALAPINRAAAKLGMKIGIVRQLMSRLPKGDTALRAKMIGALRAGQWHGIRGEVFEEGVADLASLATGLTTLDQVTDRWGSVRKVLEMTAAFAVPGAVTTGVSGAVAITGAIATRGQPQFSDQERSEILTESMARLTGKPVRLPSPSGPTQEQELFRRARGDPTAFGRLRLLSRGGPFSDEEQDFLDSTDRDAAAQTETVSYDDLAGKGKEDRASIYEQLVGVLQSGRNPMADRDLTDDERANVAAAITTLERVSLQNGELATRQWTIPEPGVPSHGPLRPESAVAFQVAGPGQFFEDLPPEVQQRARDASQAAKEKLLARPFPIRASFDRESVTVIGPAPGREGEAPDANQLLVEGADGRRFITLASSLIETETGRPLLQLPPLPAPHRPEGLRRPVRPGFPDQVREAIEATGTDPATVRTVTTDDEARELSRQYGPSNAVLTTPGEGGFAAAGRYWVDDDAGGQVIAYRPPAIIPGREPAPLQPAARPGAAAEPGGGLPEAGAAVQGYQRRDLAGGLDRPPRAFTRGSQEASRPLHLRGRDVAAVRWEPTPEVAAVLLEAGVDPVPVYEITGDVGAEVYAEQLAESAARDKYGAAVTKKTAEELARMRLFVTADGLAGAALDGEDMVAAFKDPLSKTRAWGVYAMLHMIEKGGRTADAFDTVLPSIYARAGMEVVARIPWDDTQKPADWDYETFKPWNNGRPDVTFLVYRGDPDNVTATIGQMVYKAGQGQRFDGWDDAKQHQLAQLIRPVSAEFTDDVTDGRVDLNVIDKLDHLNPNQRRRLASIRKNPVQQQDSIEGFQLRMQATMLFNGVSVPIRLPVEPIHDWQRTLIEAGKAIGVEILFYTDGQAKKVNYILGANDPIGRRIGLHLYLPQAEAVMHTFGHEWTHFLHRHHQAAWVRFATRIHELDYHGLVTAGMDYYQRIAPAGHLDQDHFTAWLQTYSGIDEAISTYAGNLSANVDFMHRVLFRDPETLDLLNEKLDQMIVNLEELTAAELPADARTMANILRALQELADSWSMFGQTEMQEPGEVSASSTEAQLALRGPDRQAKLEEAAMRRVRSLGANKFAAEAGGYDYENVKTDFPTAVRWARALLKRIKEEGVKDNDAYKIARKVASVPQEQQARERIIDTFAGRRVSSTLVRVLTGREKLDITPTGKVTLGEPTVKVADVARALDAKAKERGWTVPRVLNKARQLSDEQRERIVQQILEELEMGVSSKVFNGTGWYDRRVKAMVFEIAKLFPEVIRSQTHQAIFKYVLAISSAGNTVNRNMHAAIRLYQAWRQSAKKDRVFINGIRMDVPRWGTGFFPTLNRTALEEETPPVQSDADVPKNPDGSLKHAALTPEEVGGYLWSRQGWNIRDQIAFLNETMRQFATGEEWIAWLLEPMTVGELRADPSVGRPHAVSEESTTLAARRAIFLGPKVGVFFMNLMGIHEVITMDRWLSRTWNRFTGTLMLTAAERAVAVAKAHEKIKALTKKQFESEAHGFVYEEVQSNLAKAIAWSKLAMRQIENRNGRTPFRVLRRAVNVMQEADQGVVMDPGPAGERALIRSVIEEAHRRLPDYARKVGNLAMANLKISDIQAVEWYNEMSLFTGFGASKAQTLREDYGNAAERIVREFLSAEGRRSAVAIGVAAAGRGRPRSPERGAGAGGRRPGAPSASAKLTEWEEAQIQGRVQAELARSNRGIDVGLLKARTTLVNAGYSMDDAAQLVRRAAIDVIDSRTRRLSHAVEALAGLPAKTLEQGLEFLAGNAPMTGKQRSLFTERPLPDKPTEDGPSATMTAEEAKILRAVLVAGSKGRAEGARAGRGAGEAQERARGTEAARSILERLLGAPSTTATKEVMEAQERARKAQRPEQVLAAAVAAVRAQANQARRELAGQARRRAADIQGIKIKMRDAVRASGLPMRMWGRFLGDVATAQTPGALARALRKVELLSASVRFNESINELAAAERLASRAARKLLGPVERKAIAALAASVQSAAFSKGRRRATHATPAAYDAASAAISDAARQIAQIVQARADEVRLIRATRVATRDQHIQDILSHLGYDPTSKTFRKEIKGRAGKYEDLERSFFRRGIELRLYYDTETLTRKAERRWQGDGVLTALMSRGLKQAEEGYNSDLRDEMKLLEKLVRENLGYENLSRAFMRMMGTFGDSSLETVRVRIGGQDRTLAIDVIAELLALDQDTVAKIEEGRPIEIETARHMIPIQVSASELAQIRADFGTRFGPFIDALKARLETSIRPRAFAVHRVLRGWEPDIVSGYWPTHVDAGASEDVGLAEAFRGGGVTGLIQRYYENAGFLKPREDATSPYVIRGLLANYMRHVDHAVKVIHFAEVVRDAASVLLNPVTRDAIARVHGAKLYEQLRNHLLSGSLVNRDSIGGAERALRWINSNMVASYLTTNPGTYIRQWGGLFPLWSRMPAKYFLIGIKRLRPGTLREMKDNSGFLWARYQGDSYARYSPVAGSGVDALDHVAFTQSLGAFLRAGRSADWAGVGKSWQRVLRSIKLLDWNDAVVARVAWEGFKAQAADEGRNLAWVAEQTANAVRATQNTSSPLDAGTIAMESRNSLWRYFLLFTTQPMKQLNMLIQGFHMGPRQAAKDATGVALGVLWSGAVVTATLEIGSDLIAAGIASLMGADDDRRRRELLAQRTRERVQWRLMRDAAGLIPVIGDAIVTAFEAATKPWLEGSAFEAPVLELIDQGVVDPITQVARAIEKADEQTAEETWLRIFSAVQEAAAAAATAAGNPLLMPYYRGKRIAEAVPNLPAPAKFFFGIKEPKQKKGEAATTVPIGG